MNTSLQNTEPRADVARAEHTQSALYTPRVDILEKEDELVLFADMPGVKPEDADVRYENGELTLHGRCAPRRFGDGAVAAEYGVGDFYRAFTLSEDVDAQKITAELKNGVLTVHLPKVEAVKPRRIKVTGE